jgi:hypothetical protein
MAIRELKDMRVQSMAAKIVRWLAGAVALAGFVALAQPDPLPPGSLAIELWLKIGSPGGGIYGTAEKLVRWGCLLYGGKLLSPDRRAAMMQETPESQNAVKTTTQR